MAVAIDIDNSNIDGLDKGTEARLALIEDAFCFQARLIAAFNF